MTKTGTFKKMSQPHVCGSFFAIDCRWKQTISNSIVLFDPDLLDYCSVVWEGLGVRTSSEASRNSKTSYDHKFSAGYISSTAPPLQKLGWDRCSKQPVDIHNGGLYKHILFVWYLAFLNSFESKCFFVFCTCFNMCKVRKDNNIHIKHYINKPPLWKRSIKLLMF